MTTSTALTTTQPLTRLVNWRSNLQSFILTIQAQHFEYGVHDCIIFPANCIRAMTGVDLAIPYRGKYKTLRGGIGLLKKHGYKDQFDYIKRNFTEYPPSMAQTGDIALVDIGDSIPAGGIVYGDVIYMVHRKSIAVVPITMAATVYRF